MIALSHDVLEERGHNTSTMNGEDMRVVLGKS